jgi:protein gp37
MGSKTGIEWTDATWNPIIGCSRVSEGCRNCYAEGIAGRFGQGKQTVYSGLTQIVNGRAVWTGKIVETRQLLQPLSWRKPKRVFVNSMSDLFHENVTDEQRDRIFAVMALCPQHTFQVLTKRPERMLKYLRIEAHGRWLACTTWHRPDVKTSQLNTRSDGVYRSSGAGWWPLRNVWLGVSVENQAAADERIPVLLRRRRRSGLSRPSHCWGR